MASDTQFVGELVRSCHAVNSEGKCSIENLTGSVMQGALRRGVRVQMQKTVTQYAVTLG